MPRFVRIVGFVLYLAFGALGFAVVSGPRTDDDVSTFELVISGWVPVIIGFAICWGALALADRLDSRPCPQCGRLVRIGSYVCPACGFDYRRTPAPFPQG